MSRHALLACAAMLTIACGEKKEPASSADAAAEEPAATSESSSTLPQDKASKAFVKALVDLEIARFSPTDDGVLKYDTLVFSADATWSAQAAVEIMDLDQIIILQNKIDIIINDQQKCIKQQEDIKKFIGVAPFWRPGSFPVRFSKA